MGEAMSNKTKKQLTREDREAWADRLIASMTDEAREQAPPLDQRRDAILHQVSEPFLELAEIEAERPRLHIRMHNVAFEVARLTGQSPRAIMRRIRQGAGLPTEHDAVPASLPEIVRVFGRMLSASFIGPRGIGSRLASRLSKD
jgi:hypothetical protein